MRGDYNVYKTDYDNYSIVFSNTHSFFGMGKKNVWILHRQMQPPQGEVDRLIDEACRVFELEKSSILYSPKV